MNQTVESFVQIYRTKNKITQEELARQIGVTRQTIIAIEKGNYTPSVYLSLKIARYFKTSVEKLFKIKEL